MANAYSMWRSSSLLLTHAHVHSPSIFLSVSFALSCSCSGWPLLCGSLFDFVSRFAILNSLHWIVNFIATHTHEPHTHTHTFVHTHRYPLLPSLLLSFSFWLSLPESSMGISFEVITGHAIYLLPDSHAHTAQPPAPPTWHTSAAPIEPPLSLLVYHLAILHFIAQRITCEHRALFATICVQYVWLRGAHACREGCPWICSCYCPSECWQALQSLLLFKIVFYLQGNLIWSSVQDVRQIWSELHLKFVKF